MTSQNRDGWDTIPGQGATPPWAVESETAMSFVVAAPETLAAAAADMGSIGSTLNAANTAAARATTTVLAAAGDEVSAAIASLFSSHGQEYQALSAQASVFHAEFVRALTGAGGSVCDGRGGECVAVAGCGAGLGGVFAGEGSDGAPAVRQRR